MKLKASLGMAALLLGLSAPALAEHDWRDRFGGIDGKSVLGGGLGGAAGAALGSALGGRDAAMLGSAIGAAAGVYVLGERDPRYGHDYEPRRVNHHHYYHGKRLRHDNGLHRGHYTQARHHYRHWDD